MSPLWHWMQAARPLAQGNIAIPLLFGQALAHFERGLFDARWCAAALAWGLVDQLLIVFANDYADREHDGAERTLFSGGSGVLPDGKIEPHAMRAAAGIAALGLFGLSLAFSLLGRPLSLAAWLAAVALIWAYSFAPLRLSYRGNGEVLQALGVGWTLPSLGYYLQAGELSTFPLWALAPLFLLGFAGNVTTALPDLEADRRAAKRTWALRFGPRAARLGSVLLIALAAALFAFTMPGASPLERAWLFALPALPLLANLVGMWNPRATDRGRTLRFVIFSVLAMNLALATAAFVCLR